MATQHATDSSAFIPESLNQPTINGDPPRIKTETDSHPPSPSPPSDEDIYEDAGDLDFAGTTQGVYLVRIPKFLWETWAKLDGNDEVQIGTIRVEGSPHNVKRMSLLLSSDAVQNETVPKEYNMHVTNQNPTNTFIFTEQDLPGYTSRMKRGARHGQVNGSSSGRMQPRYTPRDRSRPGLQNIDKTKRWQPSFRKAIPKQTSLAGQIQTEINCLPVENAEYRQIMDLRAKQAMKPKATTRLLDGPVSGHGGNILAPGTLGPSGNFDSFIKNTGTQRGKAPESRAARIPQNELLDLIYECFKKYNYWPLKSLKAELNQPEAYLKQTLEMVAHLVRQGPHAMTWQLKPESKIGAYADARLFEQVKDEVAPDMGFDGASDYKEFGEPVASDEDDENVKMKDVVPH